VAYAAGIDVDQRRGTWLDPARGKTTLGCWVGDWVSTLDVEPRTEENYRGYPVRRPDLYEITLVEGTLDDVRELVNGAELVRVWEQMYLPPWVRAAWQPLIDAAHPAA